MAREEHQDTNRCTECGGKCCRIYISCLDGGTMPETLYFDEWVTQWKWEFEDCGATEIEPLFDPLIVHLAGNEHMLKDLEKRGIDPCACQYLRKDGCSLPRDKMPNTCKEYRCGEWVRGEI